MAHIMYNEHTNLLKLLKCDDFFYLLLRGLLILNIYSHTTYLLLGRARGLVVVSRQSYCTYFDG